MKILFVHYVMDVGGVESFIMNVSRLLYSNNEIHYLTFDNPEQKFYYEDEIKANNGKIYKLNKKSSSEISFIKNLVKIMKTEKYDVVHSNSYVITGEILLAAFLAGVKVRVAHSHSSWEAKGFKQKVKYFVAKSLIKLFATRKIACSELAGIRLFGRSKYQILENGVNLEKYKFDFSVRNSIREHYNISENEKVIGHVGRFDKVKNHKFIVELFDHLTKNKDGYKLMLVGNGDEFENIKTLVATKKLEDKVIFVGQVDCANIYYNAMDCMIFPSFYEGLPFTFVEAQINGLNIVASDTISKSSNLIGNVSFLSLDDNIEIWASMIKKNSIERNFDEEYFLNSNYNLDNTLKKLLSIYTNK